MHSTCIVMINYAMLHYSNLNYAQYKPSCMRYALTYHHDASCFLIAGGYPSMLIHIVSYGRQNYGILQVQLHHYHSWRLCRVFVGLLAT